MGTVLQFNGAFSPEAAATMGAALTAAWLKLQRSGSVYAAPFKAASTHELLALRIVVLARQGERDFERLRDGALSHILGEPKPAFTSFPTSG